MAIIASSTNKPNAKTNAPNDTLCKPISKIYIPKKVVANTNGIDKATTKPVLKPKLKKVTAKTTITASKSALVKLPTEFVTAIC